MTTYSNVRSIKVSPGIGMARVGNSQPANNTDRGFFYLGPEEPNTTVQPPDGPYKDNTGRILRQAQRYRVFAYNASGALLGEVAGGDTVNGTVVQIQWSTHLRNMKAANYSFQGQYGFSPDDFRNSNIPPNAAGTDPASRDSLIIDPGPKSITGMSQGPVELLGPGSTIFDVPAGKYTLPGALRFDPPQNVNPDDMVSVDYTSATVSLGKLYTDDAGRLIVVGGEGAAGSCTTPAVVISKITEKNNFDKDPQFNGNSYFNNPGWYDDTAGGSINAALVDPSQPGKTLFTTEGNAEATGWIGVSPPKYAPTAYNIVSILDLQLDLFPEQDPYTGAGPVYYAITGTDNRPYIAQTAAVGQGAFSFAPAAPAGQVTTMAGTVAVLGGKVFYAITGTDDRPYIASSVDGSPGSFHFAPAAPAGQVTKLPPALAVFNGQLFYAITGTDDRPYIASSTDGAAGSFSFQTAAPAGQVTQMAPALSAFNGQLTYAITGTDSRPYIATSANGATGSFSFSPAAPAGQVTDRAPALAVFAGQLYYAITGTDSRPYIALSVEGSAGSFNFQTVAPAGQVTALAPALAAFNGRLDYAITGTDDRPYIGSTAAGMSPAINFQPAAPAGQVTQLAPALATREPINFYRDIFPLLKIATDYAWTSELAYHGHRPGAQGDFLRHPFIDLLADPAASGAEARSFVFKFIRPPSELTPTVPPPPQPAPVPVITAHETQRGALMPRLTGNGGSVTENTVNNTKFPNQWLSLTNHQLSKIQRWVNGDFVSGVPTDLRWSHLPADKALDFAALQPTVGGGFHPGIELTYLMQESTFFADAFRFAAGTVPGSIAGYMSIPWQGDFWSCNTTFWPAARPDISIFLDQGQTPPLLEPRPWFRGSTIPPQADMISNYNDGYQTMADNWPRYGFVVPAIGQTDQGEQVFKEIERDPTLDDPTVLATVTAQDTGTGDAIAASSGAVVSQPENVSVAAQQWVLQPTTVSPSFFLVVSVGDGNKVLTASGNAVSLTSQASPYEDSQLWQYLPSGYPGVFFLQSRFNSQVLTVNGQSVGTAPQGSGTLVQRLLLKAAAP